MVSPFMPLDSEVSLVFQGPILNANYNPNQGHFTHECLAAARRVMPKAEIILSTWEGVNVEGLDCDELVLSKDPGFLRLDSGWTTNVNRQIVSTRKGLAKASRPFAAKIRTDTILTGADFLKIPRVAAERLSEWSIFSERILISEKFSRNPLLSPLLHCPSDVFQFGKTNDLIQLWDSPLVDAATYQLWNKDDPKPFLTPFSEKTYYTNYYKIFCSRYYHEQYIWLQCCRRQHPEVHLNYPWEADPEQIQISESLLTANFKISRCEEVGIRLPKRLAVESEALSKGCYTSREWDSLTGLYQNRHNFFRQNLRIWKVYLGIWRHLILATTQRVSVDFLDYLYDK